MMIYQQNVSQVYIKNRCIFILKERHVGWDFNNILSFKGFYSRRDTEKFRQGKGSRHFFNINVFNRGKVLQRKHISSCDFPGCVCGGGGYFGPPAPSLSAQFISYKERHNGSQN